MAELSRKKRFQELRDQLDEESSTTQSQTSQPIKLSRSSRPTAASHAGVSKAAPVSRTTQPTVAVMDELLGEVKQYNIDKGERILEDTQINILRTLDEGTDIEKRRRAHLETMEPNTDAGGTTMNINSKDIEQVSRQAAAPVKNLGSEEKTADLDIPMIQNPSTVKDDVKPVKTEKTVKAAKTLKAGKDTRPATKDTGLLKDDGLTADLSEKDDQLEFFDLNADDFDKTIRQEQPEQPVSRKEIKARKRQEKKSSKKTQHMIEDTEPTDQYFQDTDQFALQHEEPRKSSKIGNIILIVLILALIALIGYTIYLISRANLL